MTVSLRRSPKWIYLPVKPLERLQDLKGKKQTNRQKTPRTGNIITQELRKKGEKMNQVANFLSPSLPFSMGRLFSGHWPLQLGGVKTTFPYHDSQRHFRGFVGCIRNVVVDSKVGLLRPVFNLLLLTVDTWCVASLCPFPGLWFRAPGRVLEQCSRLRPYGWNVSEGWDGLLWHPWQVCWWLGFFSLWLFPRICWTCVWKRYWGGTDGEDLREQHQAYCFKCATTLNWVV